MKYQLGKANVDADTLSRSWPRRQEDQESKQVKIKQASTLEVDSTHDQDQDLELFDLIQASTISLFKTKVQQFLKAQIADLDSQKMLAQHEKEFKR